VIVLAAALFFALWLEPLVSTLTEASGAKRALARAAVWGGCGAAAGLWIWRRTLLASLERLAAWLERGQGEGLARRAAPGRFERAAGTAFAAAGAALTAFAIADAPTFTRLFEEDGPFEYASAVLYFWAAGACIVLALRVDGRARLRLWLAGLAALFVFVGGEEVSWGQRLFGFGTPEELAAVNVQGEFTLHNVWSNSLFVYPGLAVTAALLFVLPLLHRHHLVMRRMLDALEFPVAPLRAAALYAFAAGCYAVTGLALGTPTPLPINWSDHLPHYDDELFEFLISALFAIHAASFWRIVPVPAEASSGPGRGELAAP
ncbi:MAG: hypothetical protein V2I39_07830, partial [Erythrobacter sp.]|nr:hypothetical protein [Erythrobacter sp.]